MSQFTFVNYQRPSHHDEDKLTKLCLCCLEKDVTFVNLSTCKHSKILEKLCSVKIPKMELGHLVCYPCHSKLKTINDFKLQAEESFTKLWKQQNTATKIAPKLKQVFRMDENINIDGTTIKTEPEPVTEYPEVVSGSWLSEQEQPILPDIGPQSGWEPAVLVPIKQEVPDDEPDLSDDEDPILPIPIPTKVTNYHLEVSGLCLRSPQDSGSDLDSDDESLATIKIAQATDDVHQATDDVPLATIKQELEIEFEVPAVNPEVPVAYRKEGRKKTDDLSGEIARAINVVTLTDKEVILERQMDKNSERFLRNPFRCEKCIISFGQERMLKEHNANKHEVVENSFQCNICESVFLTSKLLMAHEKKIHYTRFECGVCQQRYSQRYAINDHYNKMHQANSDVLIKYCDECDYFTPQLQALKYHKQKFHSGNLGCDFCSTRVNSKSALMKHMSTKHPDKMQAYSCEHCGKTFGVKHYLNVHIKKYHENFYCTPCNRIFRKKRNFTYHLTYSPSHRGDKMKKFTCDYCSKKFISKSKVRDHIGRYHLKEWYTCYICHKTLLQLQSHFRKHTSEKPSHFKHEKTSKQKESYGKAKLEPGNTGKKIKKWC